MTDTTSFMPILSLPKTHPPFQTVQENNWDSDIVDILGLSAWDESYYQTFGYRWKGEDTLTWGNPNEWVLINWVRNVILNEPAIDTEALISQTSLRYILQDARIAKLKQIYIFRDDFQVRRFLAEHTSIIPILLEAYPVLLKFFGAGMSLSLEVISDPDIPNYEVLFGYIHPSASVVENAFEKLNAMDEAWFLKQIDVVGDLFNFNLE